MYYLVIPIGNEPPRRLAASEDRAIVVTWPKDPKAKSNGPWRSVKSTLPAIEWKAIDLTRNPGAELPSAESPEGCPKALIKASKFPNLSLGQTNKNESTSSSSIVITKTDPKVRFSSNVPCILTKLTLDIEKLQTDRNNSLHATRAQELPRNPTNKQGSKAQKSSPAGRSVTEPTTSKKLNTSVGNSQKLPRMALAPDSGQSKPSPKIQHPVPKPEDNVKSATALKKPNFKPEESLTQKEPLLGRHSEPNSKQLRLKRTESEGAEHPRLRPGIPKLKDIAQPKDASKGRPKAPKLDTPRDTYNALVQDKLGTSPASPQKCATFKPTKAIPKLGPRPTQSSTQAQKDQPHLKNQTANSQEAVVNDNTTQRTKAVSTDQRRKPTSAQTPAPHLKAEQTTLVSQPHDTDANSTNPNSPPLRANKTSITYSKKTQHSTVNPPSTQRLQLSRVQTLRSEAATDRPPLRQAPVSQSFGGASALLDSILEAYQARPTDRPAKQTPASSPFQLTSYPHFQTPTPTNVEAQEHEREPAFPAAAGDAHLSRSTFSAQRRESISSSNTVRPDSFGGGFPSYADAVKQDPPQGLEDIADAAEKAAPILPRTVSALVERWMAGRAEGVRV